MKNRDELIKVFQDYKDLRDSLLVKKRELEEKAKSNKISPWTLDEFYNYYDEVIFSSIEYKRLKGEFDLIREHPDYEKIIRSAHLKVLFNIEFIPQ